MRNNPIDRTGRPLVPRTGAVPLSPPTKIRDFFYRSTQQFWILRRAVTIVAEGVKIPLVEGVKYQVGLKLNGVDIGRLLEENARVDRA